MFKPRRELGRTGFKATILGIRDVADRQLPLSSLVDTVRRAMDTGLNVIDTAPGYENGYSEQVVGTALKGRRDGMFVIDKIDDHSKSVAPQVEASLTVAECVGYTLTCDPDVALLGLSYPREQDAAFAAATAFHPLAPAEMSYIGRRAADAVKGKGECWWNPAD